MKKRRVLLFLFLLPVAAAGCAYFLVRPAPKPESAWIPWEDWDKTERIALQSEEYIPALHRAADKGDLDKVKHLLERGADVNSRDKDGWTPLHWAAFEGKTKMVKFLLSKGALPSAKAYEIAGSGVRLGTDLGPGGTLKQWRSAHKRHKQTPLKAALAKGCKGATQALLERGAGKEEIDALLFWVSRNGYAGGVEILLANGARIDASDRDRWMPLHWAAYKGRAKTVKILLEKGASVNSRTGRKKVFFAPPGIFFEEPGQTPLHLAATKADVAKLLLAAGAQINARDAWGWTPLHKATSVSVGAEAMKFLLARGADVNARDNTGRTPLFEAVVCFEDPVNAKVLLENGADVNARDEEGNTSLHRAAKVGNTAQVKTLLSKGAAPSVKNSRGLTPLASAIQERHSGVANLLRQHGAKE